MSGKRMRPAARLPPPFVYRSGMKRGETDLDRRTQRTRGAVKDAFIRLMFGGRYDRISTAALIAEAGIGKSTFYEHYRSKDDVLVAVIDPLFIPLAEAAVGRGGLIPLRTMLDHIWEQRSLGRALFEGAPMVRLQRKLAEMIEMRLDEASVAQTVPHALTARAAAAAQLTALRAWLTGEVACPSADLATWLMLQGRASKHLVP
ncbi:TetR/AcrR family transcriptional regulator [Brevundimonas sp.]